jgi:hypothetical protein
MSLDLAHGSDNVLYVIGRAKKNILGNVDSIFGSLICDRCRKASKNNRGVFS